MIEVVSSLLIKG